MTDAEAIGSWDPPPLDTPHGLLTFGAQFAEVAVDADLGLVRVRQHGRRVRPRPGAQPQDGPQPADGRHALGDEPGPARGQPHGHPARPLGATPAWASTWSRSTPTRPTSTSSSSRSRTTSSARSGSRASARSARSARPPPSPTPCSTPPAAGVRELPIARRAPAAASGRAQPGPGLAGTADDRPAVLPRPRPAAAASGRRAAAARPRPRSPGSAWAGCCSARSCSSHWPWAPAHPAIALLILGPLATFALPAVAMVAFWWNDWPGSKLTTPLDRPDRHRRWSSSPRSC